TLADDNTVLGFYSPQDGFTLHIVDMDPNSSSANGWLEDVSKVKKYEISEEDYNQRENTYRKFKEQKLKEDPTWTLQKEIVKRSGKEVKEIIADPEHQAQEAQGIAVGNRCEVYPGSKRGEVMCVTSPHLPHSLSLSPSLPRSLPPSPSLPLSLSPSLPLSLSLSPSLPLPLSLSLSPS
ncbi:MAG: hypothetical protein GY873_40475, partial [Bosea sp.]|uniref:hypothetical protein n=1 Tax=Bosea sp. (in: a-proteobacteria) TaxID=1871050 RepID=UPI00239905C5|nr:hypothetical protein [Bosea sp. (in: a-proteobacteria)]